MSPSHFPRAAEKARRLRRHKGSADDYDQKRDQRPQEQWMMHTPSPVKGATSESREATINQVANFLSRMGSQELDKLHPLGHELNNHIAGTGGRSRGNGHFCPLADGWRKPAREFLLFSAHRPGGQKCPPSLLRWGNPWVHFHGDQPE